MIIHELHGEGKPYTWIDVISPSAQELQQLAKQYALHPAAVEDCLEPFHLSKVEQLDDRSYFSILRYRDEAAEKDADSIQELSNKLAVFIRKGEVISIHRADTNVIAELRDKLYKNKRNYRGLPHLLNAFLDAALYSYNLPLKRLAERIEDFEEDIFNERHDNQTLKRLYILRRQAHIHRRLLMDLQDVVNKYIRITDSQDPFTQDLADTARSFVNRAEQIHEHATSLINLHLSLSSYRTNEVMTVLTIFSIFFLPLTFIVGLYGMNFKNMPELQAENGYFITIGVMVCTVILTFVWFRWKRWL